MELKLISLKNFDIGQTTVRDDMQSIWIVIRVDLFLVYYQTIV